MHSMPLQQSEQKPTAVCSGMQCLSVALDRITTAAVKEMKKFAQFGPVCSTYSSALPHLCQGSVLLQLQSLTILANIPQKQQWQWSCTLCNTQATHSHVLLCLCAPLCSADKLKIGGEIELTRVLFVQKKRRETLATCAGSAINYTKKK